MAPEAPVGVTESLDGLEYRCWRDGSRDPRVVLAVFGTSLAAGLLALVLGASGWVAAAVGGLAWGASSIIGAQRTARHVRVRVDPAAVHCQTWVGGRLVESQAIPLHGTLSVQATRDESGRRSLELRGSQGAVRIPGPEGPNSAAWVAARIQELAATAQPVQLQDPDTQASRRKLEELTRSRE